MRPWLLRPPWLCCPSVNPLTGLPFHSSERLISTVPRRLAVTGLNCLSAIFREPYARLVVKSIDWPGASVTMAFLTSERTPGRPLKRLVLPFWISVFTDVTFTLNKLSIAAAISGLLALKATLKPIWFFSDRRVIFSVIKGARMMLYIASLESGFFGATVMRPLRSWRQRRH